MLPTTLYPVLPTTPCYPRPRATYYPVLSTTVLPTTHCYPHPRATHYPHPRATHYPVLPTTPCYLLPRATHYSATHYPLLPTPPCFPLPTSPCYLLPRATSYPVLPTTVLPTSRCYPHPRATHYSLPRAPTTHMIAYHCSVHAVPHDAAQCNGVAASPPLQREDISALERNVALAIRTVRYPSTHARRPHTRCAALYQAELQNCVCFAPLRLDARSAASVLTSHRLAHARGVHRRYSRDSRHVMVLWDTLRYYIWGDMAYSGYSW